MSRAAAEWALVNKVLAPVNFPLKMWIAHKYVEWRHSGEVAVPMPAAVPPLPARASES